MKIHFTPLKIWAWALSIFVIGQILVVTYFKLKEDVIDMTIGINYNSQINHMHREFKKSDSSYKTVIVGSSLIGYGVESSGEITNYLYTQKKNDIKLIKIWDKGEPLKKFIKLNLIDEIVKAKPDLVIFQTDLAAIGFAGYKNNRENMAYRLSYINKSVIKYIFSPKIKTTDNLKNRGYPNNLEKKVKLDTIKHIPQKREVISINSLSFAQEGFRRLQKEGVKTVFVDVPRPLKAEKTIYTPIFKEKLQNLFNEYNENLGIEHWNYTGTPIYYKHCIDQAHFNKNGREIYTKWLLDKIEKEK